MVLSIFKILANNKPKIMTKAIVETVKRKPWLPASIAVFRLMPKPNPIIEYCNNFLTKLSVSRTFPNIFTKRIPNNKAIGGETIGEKDKTASAKKRI